MSQDKLNFSIRKTIIEDFSDILKIRRNSLLELNPIDYSVEQIEALQNKEIEIFNIQEEDLKDDVLALEHFNIIKKNPECSSSIIAQIEDKIIGYAFISDLDIVTKSQIIYELFIHPSYVRQGVGTKLLRKLEEDAFYCGCKIITLFAFTTAESFYQANEYETIDRTFFIRRGITIPMIYLEKWLVCPTEIDKFFWNLSNQIVKFYSWIGTEINKVN